MKAKEFTKKTKIVLNLANFPALFNDAYLKKHGNSVFELKKAVTKDTIRYKNCLLKLYTNGLIYEEELENYLKIFDAVSFKNLLRLSIQIVQNKSLEEVIQSKDDSFAVYAKLHSIYLSVGELSKKRTQRFYYLHEINANLEKDLKNASPDVSNRIQKEIIKNKKEINGLSEKICKDQDTHLSKMIESTKLEKGSEELPKIKNPLPAVLQDPNQNLEYLESATTIIATVKSCNHSVERKEDEDEKKDSDELKKQNQRKITRKENTDEKIIKIYHEINERIEIKLETTIGLLQSQLLKNLKRFTLFSYSTVIENAHINMKIQILNDAKNSLFENFDNNPHKYIEVLKTLLNNDSVKKLSEEIVNEIESELMQSKSTLIEKLKGIDSAMSEIYGRTSPSITKAR